MLGIIFSIAVSLYFIVALKIEKQLDAYVIKTLRYYVAILVKYIYGFLGALLVRIGYSVVKGKILWQIERISLSMFIGLLCFAMMAWHINSFRSILFNMTFIIVLWDALLFAVK